MERRSTNDIGYVHYQGDVTAQVGSSHGVRLSGGSTGGVVEAVGDDTNVTLTLRQQGAGGIQIGRGSTTGFLKIERYRIDYTVPVLSSNSAAASTVTQAGLTTASILILQERQQNNSSVVGITIVPRCSTVNELTLTFYNNSVSSVSGSTQSGYLLQVSF